MPRDELLDIQTADDVFIVSFRTASIGALSGVEEIAGQLRRFIGLRQPKKMIIDFHGVLFFSSKMLGLLVDVWKRLKDCGGTIVISGINPQLTRVFRITNLDKIFDFYDDAEAALKALGAKKNEQ